MGSSNMDVFELTLPSRMEELSAVHDLVDKATRAFNLNEEIAHWIELAVSDPPLTPSSTETAPTRPRKFS